MTAVAIRLHENSAVVYQELGGTCTHMPGCGFYESPNSVTQCEEFTPDEAPALPLPRPHRAPISTVSHGADGSLQGLCVNCDEREHCAFRTPGRAVWYCEEYR